jgi:hypothetical protein
MRNQKLFGFILGFVFAASTPALAALSELDRASISATNKLGNPGAEQGKAKWTAAGGTFNAQTSTKRSGASAFSWDSSGAAQTITSTAVTLPGGNAAYSWWIKCATGTCTHKLGAYDGATLIAETSINSSTADFVRTTLNFSLSAATSVTLKITSVAADEPTAYFDDGFAGEAPNIAQASQSTFFGSIRWTGGSCIWSRTASSSFGSYSAGTCTTPSGSNLLGNALVPATNVPGIKFSTMKKGRYYFVAYGAFYAATAGVVCSYRFTDGTNNTNPQTVTGSVVSDQQMGNMLIGELSYSSAQSNITVEIQGTGSGASGDCRVYADNSTRELQISAYYFPDSSDEVLQPSQVANQWQGYHDNDCAWTSSAASYTDFGADGSCTFTERKNNNFGSVSSAGSKTPGITFTPKKANTTYFVLARATAYSGGAAACSVQLTDGTTVIDKSSNELTKRSPFPLMGLYTATSTLAVTLKLQGLCSGDTLNIATNGNSTTIEWTLFELSSFGQFQIANQVQTSNASGDNIVRCKLTYSGGTPSCSKGSGVSSVTDTGTGDFTLNFTTAFSDQPQCTCTPNQSTVNGAKCEWTSFAAGSAAFRIRNTADTLIDENASILCVGPR